MRYARAILSLALTGCLMGCCCTGCTPAAEDSSRVGLARVEGKPVLVGDIPCTFPLVEEPTTLHFMEYKNTATPCEDVYVWQKYAALTGVDVQWKSHARENYAEAMYQALVNQADVDLFLRYRVSPSTLMQYGERGLVIDLAKDGLLERYAPNCWKYLQSHPVALASITNPDGSIYALPQINSGAELRVSRKIFINKRWLANVNMELPTTTEAFYDLLCAFQTQDANGNGDPNDEIPLCSQDWRSLRDAFYGAFGLMNRGIHNETVDCDEATGAVRLIAATDGYRDFLTYFHKLYDEQLIPSNTFTMTSEEWLNNARNDRIGVFCNTNLAGLPANQTDEWIGITEALEGPTGEKLWSAVRADLHSTGNAVIPATCKDPALVLRWLDYFWTDAGTLFYHMGVENETYVVKEDGSYDYAPAIYAELQAGDTTFDEVVAKYSPYPGGGNPTVEVAPYFMGGELAAVPAACARALFPYGPSEFWPIFTFTADETETLNALSSDIEKYCTDSRIGFITGTTPLDDTHWTTYLTHLSQFQTDQFLSIYQTALDRYQS